MAAVVALHRHSLTRPVVAWVLVGAALAWTVTATVLVLRNPGALERLPAISCELVIACALGIGGGFAYAQTHNSNVAFSSVRTIGFAWPLAVIITVGVVYGTWAGAGVGVLVALPRFFAPIANGLSIHDYDGSNWFSLFSTVLLYAIAGSVAGYMAALLRRAQDEVAAARAREQVARTLHDGVLQTLAVIERRADDPQLATLAASRNVSCVSSSSAATGRTRAISARVCDMRPRVSRTRSADASTSCSRPTCPRSTRLPSTRWPAQWARHS